MTTETIVLVAIFAAIAVLIGVIAVSVCRTRQEPERAAHPLVLDPALPDVQAQMIERLVRLPHVRRLRDGSVFDYFRGARLYTCRCSQLSYPHLILSYGRKSSVVFEAAGSLAHYVSVQESIARLLATGTGSPS